MYWLVDGLGVDSRDEIKCSEGTRDDWRETGVGSLVVAEVRPRKDSEGVSPLDRTGVEDLDDEVRDAGVVSLDTTGVKLRDDATCARGV
jgi:hypothetical protein